MKKIKKPILSLLSVVVLSSFLFASGCSSSTQLPEAVCEYGDVIFDMAELLVQTFPNLPPEIMTYINLGRVNLQILCESEPGSDTYKEALSSLTIIKDNLRIAVTNFSIQLKEKPK